MVGDYKIMIYSFWNVIKFKKQDIKGLIVSIVKSFLM